MRRSGASLVHITAWLGASLLAIACRSSETGDQPRPSNTAPAASSATADQVLARFDGQILTVRDFEARLAAQPPQVRAQFATPEARRALLDEMVRLEVLALEARRRGVDRSPRIQVLMSKLLVEEMMNGLFGSEAAPASRITDEDVRRYHEAHMAEFSSPEERRALAVVLPDRKGAEAMLRKVAARPADEAFFRKAAEEKSALGEPARLVDLGFFPASSDRPPDVVRAAVFQLRRGGELVPQVVSADGQFHVLMLTGIRPAMVRTLADTQTLIRARLAQEKRREAVTRFTEDLVAGAHVQLHPGLLPAPPEKHAADAGITGR